MCPNRSAGDKCRTEGAFLHVLGVSGVSATFMRSFLKVKV